jgi:hypothetical protein
MGRREKREYRNKLLHPEWQKRRLQVLERSGWRCEWCGARDENLQVHHGYYGKDRDPWEVPLDTMYCLCDRCHERAEVAKRSLYLEISRIHPRHHWELRRALQELQAELQKREAAGDGRRSRPPIDAKVG